MNQNELLKTTMTVDLVFCSQEIKKWTKSHEYTNARACKAIVEYDADCLHLFFYCYA